MALRIQYINVRLSSERESKVVRPPTLSDLGLESNECESDDRDGNVENPHSIKHQYLDSIWSTL